MNKKLAAAVCTYNRAERLPMLVAALRSQDCPIPFEILIVDNNSNDATQEVLDRLSRQDGAPVFYVCEKTQGIPFARNRAIEECLAIGAEFMLFIDDDEIPGPGLLTAAVDALDREHSDCAGGRVKIVFSPGSRPSFLDDELLGFLGELDYGKETFWVTDRSTPLWSGNISYRMEIFVRDPSLRFDSRYNRVGHGIGGGSDAIIFRTMLDRGLNIRYRPDMLVEHHVEGWRLKRSYFLKLHYVAGRKYGQFETPEYERTFFGVPPFMIKQALSHWLKAARMLFWRKPGLLRQAMNGTYSIGMIRGRTLRYLEKGRQK